MKTGFKGFDKNFKCRDFQFAKRFDFDKRLTIESCNRLIHHPPRHSKGNDLDGRHHLAADELLSHVAAADSDARRAQHAAGRHVPQPDVVPAGRLGRHDQGDHRASEVGLVARAGIEPATFGLRIRCSTN